MTFTPSTLLFGGDYNPEQWSEEVWREDVALMRRARVNTVTLGVFSWAVLEPREGEYDFDILDRVIALLDENDIGFFLATPTASPPPWFSVAHPDALPSRPDGTVLSHGSRDTYAISAPAYRAAARRIARELGARFGSHRGLRGWHIHNEYGTLDYGPHAAAAFRVWLRERYGTLDALNSAWNTAFWSQRYGAWEEVMPPRATQYLHNPAQAIDFRRFSSDEMLAAFVEQKRAIHESGSTAPVTTNFMLPTWNHLEQWGWAQEQDIVSIDHYLDTTGSDGFAHIAYGSDLTRSWAGGPWLLMEQNARGIRIGDRTFPKSNARMIRDSLGYIARGSQGALFFQWRASAAGAEQWHGALVPHAGGESRAFRAVEELGRIIEQLGELTVVPTDASLLDARVAIAWDANSWWALETPHLPNDAVSYSAEVRATHRSFWRAGIATDFVRPCGDVGAYDLLVVPALYAMDDDAVTWVEQFVRGGGRVLMLPPTGFSDETLRIPSGEYPGRIRRLVGGGAEEIRVTDRDGTLPLDNGMRVANWLEPIVPDEGAEVIARYTGSDDDGSAAIVRSAVGSGAITYVGARLVQDSRDRLVQEEVSRAGIAPTVPGASARAVDAVRRRAAEADFVFLFHDGTVPVKVLATGRDIVADADIAKDFELAVGAVAVLRTERGAPVEVVDV